MSDTHAWFPPATVEQVLAELDEHINHLRALTSSFVGEEAQVFKYAMGEAAMHAQDARARIEELLSAPAPRPELSQAAMPSVRPAAPARHRVGEGNTQEWRLGEGGPMRRNRRPW